MYMYIYLLEVHVCQQHQAPTVTVYHVHASGLPLAGITTCII